MFCVESTRLRILSLCLLISFLVSSCITSASHKDFWGKVQPSNRNVLRYVSGVEPESLDPQKSIGQSENRIHISLFEGLVEYHPKTLEPIPAIAERWEKNSDNTEFVFYLRKNARWSNGDPITANDFVYSFRRGFNPLTAARGAELGYYIKYAKAFNERRVFVKTKDKDEYLLEKDFISETSKTIQNPKTLSTKPSENKKKIENATSTNLPESPLNQHESLPVRLTLSGKEEDRQKEINANPKLKGAIEGKEFVAIKGEDIGAEAIDDYTFKITLIQSAPYFLGMLSHPFFRSVPQKVIEKYGDAWTQPENIVTSGAFTLKEWIPYNFIHVVKDSMNWDADRVKLDEIYFYAIEGETPIFFMYTTGEIDSMQNHAILREWIEKIRPMKDWMNTPEASVSFYRINCKKPPMTDKRVRKAFSLALDRDALVVSRRYIPKPAYGFVPPIYNDYPQPIPEKFNPEKAKQLLAEAGYKDDSGKYDSSKFPGEQVELTFNTGDANKQIAEFVQAQWKQNLGINISLNSMENTAFNKVKSELEYKGFARSAWAADFMDPFAFLSLFYVESGANQTGWTNQEYSSLLDEANKTPDRKKRYELLSRAEAILLDEQPVISLIYDSTNFMKKPYLKGLYPNPQTMHAWKFVYIERDPSKWDYSIPDMTEHSGE